MLWILSGSGTIADDPWLEGMPDVTVTVTEALVDRIEWRV
jgi:hypothetical protein